MYIQVTHKTQPLYVGNLLELSTLEREDLNEANLDSPSSTTALGDSDSEVKNWLCSQRRLVVTCT
jgi:hypothetical protein